MNGVLVDLYGQITLELFCKTYLNLTQDEVSSVEKSNGSKSI